MTKQGIVIGRNPVLEALKFSPDSIEKVIILQGLSDKKIKQIEQETKQKNIRIEFLPKPSFQKLFDNTNKSEGISQGIIAETRQFNYTPIEELLALNNSKPISTLLLLDEIQDPHNLGAIIRTAAAAGSDGIIITEKNSAKVNHTVIKTSSGATNHIKISLISNIYKTIESLKREGFSIIGTASKAKETVFTYKFPERSVLIFGNEGEGLRKNILKLCDKILSIPIKEEIESLNVSVSAGIILYERMRQSRK